MVNRLRAGARRMSWEFYGRSVAAGVLGIAAIVGADVVPSVWPLLAVSGFVSLYNLALLAPARPGQDPIRRTGGLVLLDLAALTVYLHFSGDVENPLRFAYSLPVIAAAILISIRAGAFVAGLGVMVFAALAACTWMQSLPVRVEHHHLQLFDPAIHEIVNPAESPQGANYLLLQVFRLGVVLFGAAFGFGFLAKRLRERESQLREEHQRMRLLLNILPEGVALLSRDGAIMLANYTAWETLGLDARRLEDVDPRLGVRERIASFRGPVEEFETSLEGRTLNHVLARISAEGPMVWILRDLTERRRMMAELAHRSKMVDLGLLAAGIAHEIGNPLSSMSAIVEVLEMKQAPPEIVERLRALEKHISRISRIVEDVRSFAQPSRGRRTGILAGEIVEEALQIFRLHERSRHVTLESIPTIGRIRLDVVTDQVVQVLLNLLINGADACPPGGRLKVDVAQEDGEVKIAVTDNGRGMDEEIRERLFAPFFTTKEPGRGMGLGLFVSESIARAHGGRILVDSAPGRGSTVTLCLPRAPEDDPPCAS